MSIEGLMVDVSPSYFLSQTISLVRHIETRFLELGARIYVIRENELWKDGYETFKDFLEDAKVTPGSASMLASVYEHYVLRGGMAQEKLAGAPYSSLYQAIPLIERDGVESVVAKVKLLTRSEIAEEVREDRHGECKHEEIIRICSGCKKRIYEAEQS